MKTRRTIITIVAVVMLVALIGVCLVACNADSYKKKLEKKGYTVTAYEADSDEAGKIEWGVVGTKSLTDTVTVVKYKSTSDAKAAESDLKEMAGFLGGDVYRTGKIVIYGSAEGVKAAK